MTKNIFIAALLLLLINIGLAQTKPPAFDTDRLTAIVSNFTRLAYIKKSSALTCVFGLFACSLILYFLFSMITDPIHKLVTETEKIKDMDLDGPMNISSPLVEMRELVDLKVESQLEPVMDQEIANAIENIKLQQSHPEPAGDAGLPENGMALAKVEWLHEGENVLTRDGLRVSPNSPTPGTDADAFKKALTGAKKLVTQDHVEAVIISTAVEAKAAGPEYVSRMFCLDRMVSETLALYDQEEMV